MTKIALDATAVGALAGTESGVVAITDAAGTVIGYFAPVKQEYAEHYAEAAARASVAYAEGRRPKTTAEVIRDLEALESKK
jgi:hypothetical protein